MSEQSDELDAISPLRREVAEALGWKCVRMPYGLDTWVAPDGYNWAEPPYFDSEYRYAFQLLAELPVYYSWKIWQQPINRLYGVAISDWSGTRINFVAIERGVELVPTICRAWLTWKKFHHAQEQAIR